MTAPVHLVALQSVIDMCGSSIYLRQVEPIILNKKLSKALLEHCKTSWGELISKHLDSGSMHDGKVYIGSSIPLVTFRQSVCDVYSIKNSNPRICKVLKRLFAETSGWRDLGVDIVHITALDSSYQETPDAE